MVLYLLICLVSILAGCAILSLMGVDVDRTSSLFLAPVVTLSSLAIVMGGLVAGGLTVGEITPFVYALYIGLAVFGAVRRGRIVLTSWRAELILAALPLLILGPFFLQGIENYSGGPCLDAWAYVSVGQSLQQHALGTEGWMPPYVQFASQFGKATRFITFSCLALLAPLSGQHSDTQDVLGQYVGWLFFVYGSACLFFAKATGMKRSLSWIFLVLALLSGWTLKLIFANSVDNTLALCFLPSVCGILSMMRAPSARLGVLLGVVVAASLYAYPESAPFTIAILIAMFAQRMIAAPHLLRDFGRMSVSFLVALAICLSAYALGIVTFYREEVAAATSPKGVRPGENFYRLLITPPRYILPSYWGLTPDFSSPEYQGRFDNLAFAMACVLTLAAIAGIVILLRRKSWSLPLFVLAMTFGYAIALVRLDYTYAAYKLLVLAWFAVVYLITVTIAWVWESVGLRTPSLSRWVLGGGCILLCFWGASFCLQEKILYDSLKNKSVREFRKVSVLEHLATGRPVAMIVKEIYAYVWATHFLKDTKLYLAEQYRGYFIKSALDRSEPVNFAAMRYVVTDNEKSFPAPRLLAREGPYFIWDNGGKPWVLVTEVNSLFGLPASGAPESSFWIGKAYSGIQILSNAAMTATITADFTITADLTLQHALPASAREMIRVATMTGFREDCPVSAGRHSFSVQLEPGLNKIVARSAEKIPHLIHAERLLVSSPTDSAGPDESCEVIPENRAESSLQPK